MEILADFFLQMVLIFSIMLAALLVLGLAGALLYCVPSVRRWLNSLPDDG